MVIDRINYVEMTRGLRDSLLIILLSFLCTKMIILGLFVWNNYRENIPSERTKQLLRLLVYLLMIGMIIIVPCVELAIHVLIKDDWYWKILSVLYLCTIPVKVWLHSVLTQDFRYVARNYLKGRDYTFNTVQNLIIWMCSVYYYFVYTRDSSVMAEMMLLVFHLGCSVGLLYYLVWSGNLFRWTGVRMAKNACLCVYAVESALQLVNTASANALSQTFDMDLLLLTLTLFMIWTVHNISTHAVISSMLSSPRPPRHPHQIRRRLYDLEIVHYAMMGASSDDRLGVIASSWLCAHWRGCRDPLCYCWVLRERWDANVGSDAMRFAKDVFMKSMDERRDYRYNGVVDFDNLNTNTDIRKRHESVVTIKTSSTDDEIKIQRGKDFSLHSYDSNFSMVCLDSQEKISLFIASLHMSFYRSLPKSRFTTYVVITTVKFLLYEYENPIAALHFLYEYIYSKHSKKNIGWGSTFILQNLKHLCKNSLAHSIPSTSSSLAHLDFSAVLSFRSRVHSLKSTIREMVIMKIDLYSKLAMRRVDYRGVIDSGVRLKEMIDRTEEEIGELLDYRGENINLTREALIFEICVLERSFISHRLRSKYKAAIEDTKHRIGSIDPLHLRTRDFSFLNASNIVIFTDYAEHSQRIRRFTHNTAHLLDVRREELLGTPITEFMPAKIAKSHGRFVLNFVNGESRSRRRGVINTVVISRKKAARSVMILVKLEYLFFDDVHLAALVSVRKKNSHPMVYTDLSGNIIGASRKAQEKLGIRNEQESIALFTIFPRLFPVYYDINKHDDNTDDRGESISNKNPLDEDIFDENYNLKHGEPLTSEQIVDAYFFQMLTSTSAEIYQRLHEPENSKLTHGSSEDNLEQEHHWRNVKKIMDRKHLNMVGFDQMVRSIGTQKKLIIENLAKLYKARVNIETNHYQRHISLREICLSSFFKTSYKFRSFIKLFARYNDPKLTEILMISPDSLSAICQICDGVNKLMTKRLVDSHNNFTKAVECVKTPTDIAGKPQKIIDFASKPNFVHFNSQTEENLDKRRYGSLKEIKRTKSNKSKKRFFEDSEKETAGRYHQEAPLVLVPAVSSQSLLNVQNKDMPDSTCSFQNAPDQDTLIHKDIYHFDIKPKQEEDTLINIDEVVVPPTSRKNELFVPVHSSTTNRIISDKELSSPAGKSPSYLESDVTLTNKYSKVESPLNNDRSTVDIKHEIHAHLKIVMETYKIQALKEQLFREILPSRLEQIVYSYLNYLALASHEAALKAQSQAYSVEDRESIPSLTRVESDCSLISGQRVSQPLFPNSSNDPSVHSDGSTDIKLDIAYSHDQLTENRIEEQLSTLLKSSSKRSSRESQTANIVRGKILLSSKGLNLRYYSWSVFAVVIFGLIMKLVFKLSYESRINEIYNAEVNLSKFANILRPTAFTFKESLKGWIAATFRAYYNNQSIMSDLFVPDILDHYKQRFEEQVIEVSSYYQPGMHEYQSFLDPLPEIPISVFALIHTEVWYYFQMINILYNNTDKNYDQQLEFYRNVRKLSRVLHKRMLSTFESLESFRRDNLESSNLYLYLSFSTNLVSLILVLALSLVAEMELYYEIKRAAYALLKTEKKVFRSSMKALGREARLPGQKYDREKGEMREIVEVHLKHMQIMETENLSLKENSLSSLGRNFVSSNPESAMRENYSLYSNFAKRRFMLLFCLYLLVMTLIDVPSYFNLMSLISFYDSLGKSIFTSSTLNMASASILYIASIQYRLVIQSGMPEVAGSLDTTAVAFAEGLKHYVETSKRFTDPYLIDVFSHSTVCSLIFKFVTPVEGTRCLELSDHQDFTLLKGVHRVSSEVQFIEKETAVMNSQNSSIDDVRAFFESESFRRYDSIATYQTIAMKQISGDYMTRILATILDASKISNTILAFYFVLQILYLVMYRLVRIRQLMQKWRKMQAVYLVCNDTVVNNVYIRAYFGRNFGN